MNRLIVLLCFLSCLLSSALCKGADALENRFRLIGVRKGDANEIFLKLKARNGAGRTLFVNGRESGAEPHFVPHYPDVSFEVLSKGAKPKWEPVQRIMGSFRSPETRVKWKVATDLV